MEDHPLILTVNQNQRNLELLDQFLQQSGYQTLKVSDLAAFEQALQQGVSINLALVDIAGFDSRIWDYCKQIHKQNIPLLVISPRQSAAIEQQSLAHGARSVLVKPLVIKRLLTLIHTLIEE